MAGTTAARCGSKRDDRTLVLSDAVAVAETIGKGVDAREVGRARSILTKPVGGDREPRNVPAAQTPEPIASAFLLALT